jgi:hypothetical protein
LQRCACKERLDLTDRVHAEQPTLLYSVLVRQRFGATMVLTEVLHQAAAAGLHGDGGGWREVARHQRGVAGALPGLGGSRARFAEGLAEPQVDAAIHDAFVKHPKVPLLAHAMEVMRCQGWLGSTWSGASRKLPPSAAAVPVGKEEGLDGDSG